MLGPTQPMQRVDSGGQYQQGNGLLCDTEDNGNGQQQRRHPEYNLQQGRLHLRIDPHGGPPR